MDRRIVVTGFCVVERDFVTVDLQQRAFWRCNVSTSLWAMFKS